jgi:hypothetical protein
VDQAVEPRCWAVLGVLRQLSSLRVSTAGEHGDYLQHITAAAPQLTELCYRTTECVIGAEGLASVTRLRSLASLQLDVRENGGPQVVGSCTALTALTHLGLEVGCGEELEEVQGLVAALGKLAGLRSLKLVWDSEGELEGVELQPLSALQGLTALTVLGPSLCGEQARVLAGLGALQNVEVAFTHVAAAAAAGLARLRDSNVSVVLCPQPHDAVPVVEVAGELSVFDTELACFGTRQLHTLFVICRDGYHSSCAHAQQLQQGLQGCTQLRALRIYSSAALHADVLSLAPGCGRLEHLHLGLLGHGSVHGGSAQPHVLVLLAGCSRLRQLTLHGVKGLSEGTLCALMVLPSLRLLRLLGCAAALSQERCQALAGQLGRHRLQVDVVVDDGSLRAMWMIERLEDMWREAA